MTTVSSNAIWTGSDVSYGQKLWIGGASSGNYVRLRVAIALATVIGPAT